MCARAGTHVCMYHHARVSLSLSLLLFVPPFFFIFTLHRRKSEEYILYLATRLLQADFFRTNRRAEKKKRADMRAMCLPCVILGLIAKLRVWFGTLAACMHRVRAREDNGIRIITTLAESRFLSFYLFSSITRLSFQSSDIIDKYEYHHALAVFFTERI